MKCQDISLRNQSPALLITMTLIVFEGFCLPAIGQQNFDVGIFQGDWIADPPNDISLNFRRDSSGNIVVHGPTGPTTLYDAQGEHNSNFRISTDEYSCFYKIIPLTNNEMDWFFKFGEGDACFGSVHLKYIGGGSIPPFKMSKKTYWSIYGSTVSRLDDGRSVTIYYEHPIDKLRRAGISKGALKFKGEKNGQIYKGVAYVYTKYCPGQKFGYEVHGGEDEDHTLTLSGPSPVVDQNSCTIRGHIPPPDGSGSVLVFTPLSQEIAKLYR